MALFANSATATLNLTREICERKASVLEKNNSKFLLNKYSIKYKKILQKITISIIFVKKIYL